METVFLVTIILLGSALVVVTFSMLNVIKGLKQSVSRLEGQISALNAEVNAQKRNLEAIQGVLQKKPEDPWMHVFGAIAQYKSRGFWPALAIVGTRLFRSYLSDRAKRRAMPLLDSKKELKNE